MAHKITKKSLYDSLTEGKLKGAMQYVADPKNKLSLQIRGDYLNIYYRGGNILRINGPESFWIDQNYFVKADDKKEKTKELLNIIKVQGDFKDYFEKAKTIMDNWFATYSKPEREEQQKLILQNSCTNKDSEFVIIDIEFTVSTISEYCYQLDGEKRKLRYDIIAIRKKDNRLCVMELKKGTKSLKGKSGIADHLENFNNSIKLNPQPFIQEIRELLEQKQVFGLIDEKLTISDSPPLFMFAYSYELNDELEEFKRIHRESCENIPIILLPKGKLLLEEL
jgi:hypothetical protein